MKRNRASKSAVSEAVETDEASDLSIAQHILQSCTLQDVQPGK